MGIFPYGSMRFAAISSRIASNAPQIDARSSSPSSSRLAIVRLATTVTTSPNSSLSSAASRQASSTLISFSAGSGALVHKDNASEADRVLTKKFYFFRGALPPKSGVSRWKTPKTRNRFAVPDRKRIRKMRLAHPLAHQANAILLVGQGFRMHQGHIQEVSGGGRQFEIKAACNGVACSLAG